MQAHPHTPRLAALLVAVCLAGTATTVVAQAARATPAPGAAASAPGQPGPRLMSPEALRDSGTAPGSLHPARPALPQVSLLLGTPPPAPAASTPGVLPPSPAASAGGMSNAVARCEAKTSPLERRECRRQLAQQSPARR